MHKLIIQIPCFNEELMLGIVLNALPKTLAGFDCVETLVIDDGSTDATAQVAQNHGVNHYVRLPRNQGLAKAFMLGLETCIQKGADVIVNFDADLQYRPEDIPKLVLPILENRAEIVIGERPIAEIEEFSALKKLFQRLGSWVVRKASNTRIPDAPSGFRALTREAAMQLNIYNKHTYTAEMIIQAGQSNMALLSVPVQVNPQTRPSRLVKSTSHYIKHSLLTIVRIFITYQPIKFFIVPGSVFLLSGITLLGRFLFFYALGEGSGHIQSIVFGSLASGLGFFLITIGLVADLISVNRKLLEKINVRVQRLDQNLQTLQEEKKNLV